MNEKPENITCIYSKAENHNNKQIKKAIKKILIHAKMYIVKLRNYSQQYGQLYVNVFLVKMWP